MKWSWKLGRLAGIDVRVHALFVFFVGWVALSQFFASGQDVGAALGAALFMLSVFGIVVLHELGHALTARFFGIGTRDITLLPIGGVAQLERMPRDPKQELLVALAGPAVNVVLAVVLFAIVALGGGTVGLGFDAPFWPMFLSELFWVNVSLAAFNLLPAFPMDGGRALRALLAMRTSSLRATRIAARVGRGMAWVLGGVGLFFNPMLVAVAIFVWMGATSEQQMAESQARFEARRFAFDPRVARAPQDVGFIDVIRGPDGETTFVVRDRPFWPRS